MLFIHMKIKRVVGVFGVVRVTALRLGPGDDFTHALDQDFALCDILQGKNALAMHAGTPGLDAPCVCGRVRNCRFFGHG